MSVLNFLLFDAAKAEKNLRQAQELNPLNRSLYKGRAEEGLSGVAPYLFSLQAGSDFEKWLLENGFGKSWGVFIHANLSFDDCYKHFRKFLMVKTEEGKQLYFRFYDPRVLKLFLPTCDREQLAEFFGQIKMFVVEDEDPAYALQFWVQNLELKTKRVPAVEIFGNILAAPVMEQKKPEEVTVKEELTEDKLTTEPAQIVTEPEVTQVKKRKFF